MASKKQRTETFTLMMTLHEANALLSLLTLLGSLDMESDNVVRESAGIRICTFSMHQCIGTKPVRICILTSSRSIPSLVSAD